MQNIEGRNTRNLKTEKLGDVLIFNERAEYLSVKVERSKLKSKSLACDPFKVLTGKKY
jgi:hypothetical protein